MVEEVATMVVGKAGAHLLGIAFLVSHMRNVAGTPQLGLHTPVATVRRRRRAHILADTLVVETGVGGKLPRIRVGVRRPRARIMPNKKQRVEKLK